MSPTNFSDETEIHMIKKSEMHTRREISWLVQYQLPEDSAPWSQSVSQSVSHWVTWLGNKFVVLSVC